MLNVRLIYEQIDAARSFIRNESLLSSRLALILLDNAAELIMHRELEHQFALDEHWTPKWEPERTNWSQSGLGAKYAPEERKAAESEFAPKTHILCLRLQKISEQDRQILDVCHKLRCEAFHQGVLRHTLVHNISQLLYLTVVELTVKLPFRSMSLPRPEEQADFLKHFHVEAMSLLTNEGRERMADALRERVTLDLPSFFIALSDDLVERIEHVIGGLETLGETNDRSRIDRNLQYTQFWQEIGAKLRGQGTREPDLENAYLRWQGEGHAKYTMRKIDRWQHQAETIRSARTAGAAFDSYWAVDRRLRPLEAAVSEAVIRYEDGLGL